LPQLSSGQNGAITLEKEDPDILLLWASLEGHLEVVKYLLCKQRCNLKCTDSSGQTPVDLACRNHCGEVAWFLIMEKHCSVKLGHSDAQALLEWAHR
jgi:ankyrin repeat protein